MQKTAASIALLVSLLFAGLGVFLFLNSQKAPGPDKAMIAQVRKVNEAGEGKPWGCQGKATLYPGPGGKDLVVWRHQDGHKFADRNAVEAMVTFFKDHPGK